MSVLWNTMMPGQRQLRLCYKVWMRQKGKGLKERKEKES